MTAYELRRVSDTFELDDDEELVAANLTSRENADNIILVEIPSERVNEGVCGAETDSGPCGRSVSDGGRCWQHE